LISSTNPPVLYYATKKALLSFYPPVHFFFPLTRNPTCRFCLFFLYPRFPSNFFGLAVLAKPSGQQLQGTVPRVFFSCFCISPSLTFLNPTVGERASDAPVMTAPFLQNPLQAFFPRTSPKGSGALYPPFSFPSLGFGGFVPLLTLHPPPFLGGLFFVGRVLGFPFHGKVRFFPTLTPFCFVSRPSGIHGFPFRGSAASFSFASVFSGSIRARGPVFFFLVVGGGVGLSSNSLRDAFLSFSRFFLVSEFFVGLVLSLFRRFCLVHGLSRFFYPAFLFLWKSHPSVPVLCGSFAVLVVSRFISGPFCHVRFFPVHFFRLYVQEVSPQKQPPPHGPHHSVKRPLVCQFSIFKRPDFGGLCSYPS